MRNSSIRSVETHMVVECEEITVAFHCPTWGAFQCPRLAGSERSPWTARFNSFPAKPTLAKFGPLIRLIDRSTQTIVQRVSVHHNCTSTSMLHAGQNRINRGSRFDLIQFMAECLALCVSALQVINAVDAGDKGSGPCVGRIRRNKVTTTPGRSQGPLSRFKTGSLMPGTLA